MSLLNACGQALRDLARGRAINVQLEGADASVSINVLKSVLEATGCCSSTTISTSMSGGSCEAHIQDGTAFQVASAVLSEYLNTQGRRRVKNAATLEEYIRRNSNTPEAEHLARLLSDTSASFVLDVFNCVHAPAVLEGDVPLLPPGCTHVTLTDGHGSFLGLLCTPPASHEDQQAPPPSPADVQALQAVAAGCIGSLRAANPAAAVVLAGVYHGPCKLDLLADGWQPEAMPLVEALERAHQQPHNQQPPPASSKGWTLGKDWTFRKEWPWGKGRSDQQGAASKGGEGSDGGSGQQGVQQKDRSRREVLWAAGAAAGAGVAAVLVRHAMTQSKQPKQGGS